MWLNEESQKFKNKKKKKINQLQIANLNSTYELKRKSSFSFLLQGKVDNIDEKNSIPRTSILQI